MEQALEEFTLDDFFETFVFNSGIDIPQHLDYSALHHLTSQYLTISRLGPRDVSIKYDETSQGYVLISTRGLRLIQNFMDMKQRGKAATLIQTFYRRARARGLINFLVDAVLQHRLSESDSSDTPDGTRVERKVRESYIL
jgi:hypothetical protein